MTLNLSLESRIVFLTAAGEPGDAEIAELLHQAPDWNRLLTIANGHKAAGALCRALERIASARVPRDVLLQLQRQKMVSDFHSMHLQQKLIRTLRVLREHKIEVMLLKGAALGAVVYRSSVDRPMADIDLLIHPEDAAAALAALTEAGWVDEHDPARDPFYAEHHHLAPLKDEKGTGHSIELHVRAFPPPNPFGDVAGEMWRDAVRAPEEFSGALVPSRTHMLVYACVHFAWSHKMAKAAWRTIRDIAELSRASLDWNDVPATAERWRASSSCYWTLRLANTLSGVSAPQEVLDACAPRVQRTVADILERHVVGFALPGERPPCPSLRASDMMWRAAIRPVRSGHVHGEPADHARVWLESGSHGRVPDRRNGIGRTFRVHEWWGYVGSLLKSSSGR